MKTRTKERRVIDRKVSAGLTDAKKKKWSKFRFRKNLQARILRDYEHRAYWYAAIKEQFGSIKKLPDCRQLLLFEANPKNFKRKKMAARK